MVGSRMMILLCRDTFPLFEKFHPVCDLLYGFYNSMSHHKRAPDGLLLTQKDGGKNAPIMHDTWYINRAGNRVTQSRQNHLGQQKRAANNSS